MPTFLAVFALLQAAPAQTPPAPAPATEQQAPATEDLVDVVVNRRRAQPDRVIASAADYLRRLCFDPMRKTGRPALPQADPDWDVLDETVRAKLGITDPDSDGYGLFDSKRGHTLLIKQERVPRNDKLIEQRCQMIVIADRDERAELIEGISGIMGTSGTQRHIGQRDGSPKISGWHQHLWSAIPARHHPDWRAYSGDRGESDTYVVVVTPDTFYVDHDYAYIDLKTRRTAPWISMMTVGYVTRNERKPPR